MLSVKYRPNPGSARISARSVGGRRRTSSTTTGTSAVNIRAVVRLSLSVSVMAPTRAGVSGLVLLVGVWSGRLEDLVRPHVSGVRSDRREGVTAALVGAVEVL